MKFLIFISVLFFGSTLAQVGYKIAVPSGFTKLGTNRNSTLYSIDIPGSPYDDPILLIDLHGSRYEMGYDYGKLLGARAEETYLTFTGNLIGTDWQSQIIISILGLALDWQWNSYLSKQVPKDYMDEIKGMKDGAKAAGVNTDLSKIMGRMITLANAPGDINHFIYIIIREFQEAFPSIYSEFPVTEEMLQQVKMKKILGLQCSMFAVWGSRTEAGDLFTARNLDWNKDTGIQKNKLITIYHPEGKVAHATFGFVGLGGALTGMSAAGITVHEANLEEKQITFSGFPWLLRLRYIMENAKNLADAKVLWSSTNNTVGFNHMIGSASDAKAGKHGAMVEETMYQYTAYFYENDPREQNATYTDPQTGVKSQIGFPLVDALWRTNHGYDPIIRQNYEWGQDPNTWSMRRYMYIHDGFTYYAGAGIKISEKEAVNITAIAGDKGRHAYNCADNTDGSNVLSLTFHPTKNFLFAAWENGHGSGWRPACCNTYVKIDMSKWW